MRFAQHTVTLDFENNKLDASIPTELGLLTRLESLNLKEAFDFDFSQHGPLPSELGLLTSLEDAGSYLNNVCSIISRYSAPS